MYMCGWVPLPTTWTNTSLIGYTPIQNKKFKNKRTKIRFPGFSKKKKKSLRRNYVRFLNIQLFSHPWVNHIDENVWQKHALMERVSRQVREAHKQISLIIRRAAADLLMRSVLLHWRNANTVSRSISYNLCHQCSLTDVQCVSHQVIVCIMQVDRNYALCNFTEQFVVTTCD